MDGLVNGGKGGELSGMILRNAGLDERGACLFDISSYGDRNCYVFLFTSCSSLYSLQMYRIWEDKMEMEQKTERC